MSEYNLKQCKVVLEPCTPKAQLTLSAELRNVIHERNILTARSKKKFISALDEIHDEDVAERNYNKYKEQAIQEILNTEVTYLKQLELIMSYFMEPLRERKVLTSDEFQTIFGDIATIYDVNGALLKELKEDSSKVAEAFRKLAPFFKLYSVYAYNYSDAMKKVQELHIHSSAFSKFLDNQESRPEVQTKLSSLLITPIQRVPRYLMLLKQVLENTSPSDDDYSVLKECTKQLEETANHINKQLDERENSQRLLELQRSLVQSKPNLIQANRKLIKEGFLIKIFPTSIDNKECYMVLLSDIILWCKIKKINIKTSKSLKCIAILPVHKCKVKFHADTRYIKLTCDHEDYIFYNKNELENEQWFDAIDASIKNEVNNRQTLRKISSARKAAFKKDLLNYHNPGLSPDKTRRKRLQEYEIPVPGVNEEPQEFVRRILKRRPINCVTNEEPPSKKSVTFKPENKDCLYPLREHTITKIKHDQSSDVSNDILDYNKQVFVFGQPATQHNGGFRFKIENFFTGIGNGIKRMLNWK